MVLNCFQDHELRILRIIQTCDLSFPAMIVNGNWFICRSIIEDYYNLKNLLYSGYNLFGAVTRGDIRCNWITEGVFVT
jgi:hypothetical protein